MKPTFKTRATIVGISSKYAQMVLEKNNARIQVQLDMLKKYEHTSICPQISDIWNLIGHYNTERKAFYFSPDINFHKKRDTVVINEAQPHGISKEELLRISELYTPTTIEDAIKEYSVYSQRISPEENRKALNIIMTGSSNEMIISSLYTFMGKDQNENTLPSHESKNVEFKSGINYTAINTIAAFGNTIGGTLYFGVDNRGIIVGVSEKLMNDVPFTTVADFINDFQNRIYRATNSHRFMASINFKFYKTNDGEIFFSLTVPQSDEIILIDGVKLFVRDEAGTRMLKNEDMVQYVKNHSN